MAAFADTEAARLSVYCIEAHSMRFTVVATGQFSLNRAFGFRLTASSLIQLSVVKSPIRPAGLAQRAAAGFAGALSVSVLQLSIRWGESPREPRLLA